MSTRIDAEPSDASNVADDTAEPVMFEVKDEKTANWVVRKINEARAYSKHVDE